MLMNQSSLYHKVGERTAQSSGVETSIFMATKAGSTADDAKVQGCELLLSADDLFHASKLELGPGVVAGAIATPLDGSVLGGRVQ
jgi:hypothetical protein